MEEKIDKIDYLYDDLSKIPTLRLKRALQAYQMLAGQVSFFSESSYNDEILRIEGELLGRKELILELN